MKDPVVNEQELLDILWYVKENPEEWNQDSYARKTACGTKFCVAGHAVDRSAQYQIVWRDQIVWRGHSLGGNVKKGEDYVTFNEAGRDILGLTEIESDCLFGCDTDIDVLERTVKAIISGRTREPDFTGTELE